MNEFYVMKDSKLPITFWAKAVNTACYVQNRVLVVKPHNKTPYELFLGIKPALGFMRPFGCLLPVLNTLDNLGKFDGKVDEGFFVGYSTNSKAFRVFNSRTRIVEENLHVRFNENTPNMHNSESALKKSISTTFRAARSTSLLSQPMTFPDDGLKPADDGKRRTMNARGDQDDEERKKPRDGKYKNTVQECDHELHSDHMNSDYGGASLDRKSTTGGCQFLGKRLILWQCKKQPIVANSTTEAEYVAAGNCCGQNPVFHSKTKHIEIRHQFIRDSYEKRLIEVLKIHTDHNVADLLTKGFDVSSEPINLVIFEAVFEEMYDSVESAGTTATSLEAEQDSYPSAKKQWEAYMLKLDLRVCLSPMIHHSEKLTHFEVMRTVLNSKELMDMYKFSEKVNAGRHPPTTNQRDLIKKVDGVAEIQALVDGKQIVVFDASIRRLLKFNDEGGMDCLPNCLSAKTTAWNEFSSITASSIICLSTNQQFNFSKFILEGMIRNLDAKAAKFLMYPRFVQLFVNQLEGLPEHHRQYKVPYHTKKIFANMKRKNNDFSGTVTPSFPTMVVQPPSSPPPTTSTTPTPIPTPPEPTLIPTTPAPTLTTTPPPTPTTITKSLPQTSTQSSQPSKQRIRR
ncbi:retrovirus-related pol polyprotein from transposon TNT 1-94 [Tanacetum coccineum]